MAESSSPLVTVVIAAYNRSNILHYAISSVLWQTFQDWEIVVVDDASTDDTGEVVRSFSEYRIRYYRREQNSGGQSLTNNEGVRQARGKYIAFLNQDDFWFPDHLEKALNTLETSRADWVFSLGLVVYDEKHTELFGMMPSDLYDPRYPTTDVVGSTWVLKKSVFVELGGWRDFRDILLPPSQDLILRGWKAKKHIRMVPEPTVFILPTGAFARKGCYARRDFKEHMHYFDQIQNDPRFRERELLKALLVRQSLFIKEKTSIRGMARRLAIAIFRRLLTLVGVLPVQLVYFVKFRKKGAFVASVRKNRGLSPYGK